MGSVRVTVAALVALAVSCSSDNISKPQCQSDGDCTGSAATCERFACQDDTCKVVPAAAGTPVPDQVGSACHAVQCDGSGGTTTVIDDTNTPVTNTPCAAGLCTNGTPSSVYVQQGTACGQGLVCDGAGKCIGCIAASECPGSNTQCQTVECNAGTCGFDFTAEGTPLSSQTIGDCEAVVCNGSGGTETVVNNNNVPTTENQCLQAVCTAGVPSNPPQPEGTACGSGSATLCDGSGDCVNCVFPTDCPGSDTQCQTRTCTAGVCGFDFTSAGTPLTNQTPGDCLQAQCNGSGGVQEAIDNTNTPANTACTTGTCTNGSAGFSDDAPGTSCGSGTSECDGSGNCVGCLTGSDCPGQTTDCEQPSCTMNVCGTTFTADGTPTTNQTPGDCQENVCDGSGNVIQIVDNGNTPSNTDCATGICTNGSAGFSNLPQDAVCETTDECDGSGNCVACGNNVIAGAEVCNGTDLDGETCTSLGDAPGTLACGSDCFSFDTSGCTGGWVSGAGSAAAPFGGTVCTDGLRYDGPGDPLVVCTSDQGIWRGLPDGTTDLTPLINPIWANADGSGSASVTSTAGVGVATFTNGAVKFWTSNTTGVNFWNNNQIDFDDTPPIWLTGTNMQSFSQMIVAVLPGSSNNNYMAGWDPVSGNAIVFHGNAEATPVCTANGQSACVFPVLITGATGVATSITSGEDSPASTTLDIHVVVSGTTGSNAVATGAGIYWTCNNGSAYVEDDNGIAASDKPLLFKVVADQFTFETQTALGPRTCPSNGASVTQYASVMFAGLLGGGSLYKTTNGGATWALSNTGLPAGVSVFSIAIDCGQTSLGRVFQFCANDQLVYAATSAGVYKSLDGGATWALDGLAGSVVNAVVIQPTHPNTALAASPNGAIEAGNVATFTLTTSTFPINVGDSIIIGQAPVAGYNGIWTVASVISPTQFTATLPTTGLAATGGGEVIQFLPRVFAATNQPGGLFQNNVPLNAD
jgi:hypothetical protein